MSAVESKFNLQEHPYHMVNVSPWPLLVSFSALQFVLSVLYYFTTKTSMLSLISFVQLGFFVFSWFNDIMTEASYEGYHTLHVQRSIKLAMLIFILSEVMFFFGFFWSLFHFSLVPTIWIGCVWPPAGLEIIPFQALPLLNTVLLLASGVSVTFAHRALLFGHINKPSATSKKNFEKFNFAFLITLIFGVTFLFCQWIEYNYAQYTIEDSVFGSIFYLMTGFHGLHVLIGILFLSVCFNRFIKYHFTAEHHVGFECAVWYWHFVDVVWLFLYLFIYVFGSIK